MQHLILQIRQLLVLVIYLQSSYQFGYVQFLKNKSVTIGVLTSVLSVSLRMSDDENLVAWARCFITSTGTLTKHAVCEKVQ